jgi:hypothetical protein
MQISATGVQGWNPANLTQVVGNEEMVSYYKQALRADGKILNTLNTGDSRTGKTGAVTCYIRTLLCERRESGAMLPCEECKTCMRPAGIFGDAGITRRLRFTRLGVDIHVFVIDCTSISEAELEDNLANARYFSDGETAVVFLDEVHRLQRRGLDEKLLKPMENRGIIWIANAVSVKGLERMFLNRFAVKLKTRLPTVEQLSLFLANRCLEFEIEWDDESTIIELSKRSNLITGKALQVLGRAVLNDRQLTAELVAEHLFDEDDN